MLRRMLSSKVARRVMVGGITAGVATALVGLSPAQGMTSGRAAAEPSMGGASASTSAATPAATARSARDSNTRCTQPSGGAADTWVFRGHAFQAMTNQIPRNVTMSIYSVADGVTTPDAPDVNIGQRTPRMEGIGVLDSKRIIAGSRYNTDNFFNGATFGCHTLAPFMVGQGPLDNPAVPSWNYDGEAQTRANSAGATPRWWGVARETYREGPQGWFTWTCRGPIPNSTRVWRLISSGNGFDASTTSQIGGAAPACRDTNMRDFTLTTRYAISNYGNLQGRAASGYPRTCSVSDNPLVDCWQEVYPISWARAWAFQYHVYAAAMRAELRSDARIRVPAEYDEDGIGFTRHLSWRIVGADITGAWPRFTGANPNRVLHDFDRIRKPLARQDFSEVSPFTVPGGVNAGAFTVAGYGRPTGRSTMRFTLVADTDGTWTWPVNEQGRELPRPTVNMALSYLVNNWDNGSMCSSSMGSSDAFFANAQHFRGRHCLTGSVPTLWPVPDDENQRAAKQISEFTTDSDGHRVRTRPDTDMQSTVVRSCWNESQLRVQDLSPDTAPVVGADYTWEVRLTGLIDSFGSCG